MDRQFRFFARSSLLILFIVTFLVPLAMMGARQSLQTMKNNVKDWLPKDFPETQELNWFGDHFLGERFIVVSWPGCSEDDQRLDMLVKKLRREVIPADERGGVEEGLATVVPIADADSPPAPRVDKPADPPVEGPSLGDPGPAQATIGDLPEVIGEAQRTEEGADETAETPSDSGESATVADTSESAVSPAEDEMERRRERKRARQVGDKFGLFTAGDYYEDWGGRGEKWLRGHEQQWYFITPDGELFRWNGNSSLFGYMWRALWRNVIGDRTVDGKPVALLGSRPTESEPNPFHADPRQITARYFASVTTGPELRDRLCAPGGPLWPIGTNAADEEKHEIARQRALDRLSGTLFGPDGKQTCIVLTLSEVGKQDLSRVLGREVLGKPMGKLRQLATNECGISAEDLKLGGPPVDNVAIDEEGTITLVRLVGFSVALGLGLSMLCFRSIKVTLIIFMAGGISAVASLALVYWTRGSVDAVLMSMPALVYVLGLSGAVHIVNYYRDASLEHGVDGAPERALGHALKPCALAAFTTALGLLSLSTSHVLPIQKFGYYSALGVLATLLLLFFYLPAALQLFPPSYASDRAARQTGMQNAIDRFWGGVCQFVVHRYRLVLVVCFVVMLTLIFGLPRINTSVQLLKLFDSEAKIIQDYRWMEANLGKLVPMEVVVRVAPDMMLPPKLERESRTDGRRPQERFQLSFLERMELAERVEQVVEEEFGRGGRDIVGQAMSAVSFAPELPGPAPPSLLGQRALLRGALDGNLESHRDKILAADYLRIDRDPQHQGSELWRISLRLGALNDVDYGQFVHEIKRVVEPVMSAYRDRQTIMKLIAQQVGDDRGLADTRVVFLGQERPQSTRDHGPPTAASSTVGEDVSSPASLVSNAADAASIAPSADAAGKDVIDQQGIYAGTIRDLMINAGIKEAWGGPEGKLAEWTQQQWEQQLQQVHCVVLLDDMPNVDASFLKQHSKAFLDARRSFQYAYTADASMQTAAQREDDIQTIYTGVVPVVYKAQRELLTSLINSIGWAFVMISLVMMILLGNSVTVPWRMVNVRGGLLSMLPNIFPVVVIFGLMGYMDVMVDIGSMMTASVAMGIAVDDTIHFLNWFRTGIKDYGLNRKEAIVLAYGRVASAMTQTTLIGGLGLSVFALSTFTPTQRFGVLMLALLAVALVGDLIFLPALLASPLGKYFCPATPKPSRQHPQRQNDPGSAEEDVRPGPLPHVSSRGDRSNSTVRHDHRHG